MLLKITVKYNLKATALKNNSFKAIIYKFNSLHYNIFKATIVLKINQAIITLK